MTYVVTISATYGAGGSAIGRSVAERLDVPFVDRAVPNEVAREIGCRLEDVLEHDDRAPAGFDRLLASAAKLPSVTLGSVDASFVGATDADGRLLFDEEFVEHTERVIRKVASIGGVILGRAAAIVLADHEHALHVRLDGARERRLAQAATMREAVRDEAPATGDDAPAQEAAAWQPPTMRELDDNDRARAAYVRRFYRVNAEDPRHYHLVLDSTAISRETCADLIGRLAAERAGTGK
ncbi:cytidylate kinase [Lipingzhangella halophila]|uniref:Cytidylate kinase n=1 Tax=Lipingzhangella halophila TaxID=1783352 RepID=A0A7W7W5F0_9ACTN|nr:cytidylate kinase-like family protein [Lipingzhangella halophila]MBB4933705.1 cytidylate kinase [Lipingzhangella halophila]